MNLSVTHASGWKGVHRRYFLAPVGAGLALATLVAALGLSSLELGGSNSPSAPVQSSFRITPGIVQPSPSMTYYVVGTEEERAALIAEAMLRLEDDAEYYAKNHWSFEVLVAGTAEQEAEAAATIADVKARWASAGATGLEILDLRQDEPRRNLALPQQPIIIYLVESQARADHIRASVDNEVANDTSGPLVFAFKATTPEEEASVDAIISSWFGRDIQVIDFRGMPTE